MQQILANGNEFECLVGNDDGPQGDSDLIEALADLLQRTYGWPIKPENIALTRSSHRRSQRRMFPSSQQLRGWLGPRFGQKWRHLTFESDAHQTLLPRKSKSSRHLAATSSRWNQFLYPQTRRSLFPMAMPNASPHLPE